MAGRDADGLNDPVAVLAVRCRSVPQADYPEPTMVDQPAPATSGGGGRRARAEGTYWQGWFWEAEVLILTDFAETDVMHRHVALQVVVSLGHPAAMHLADGRCRVSLGTVVASDVPHAYDSGDQPTLGLWIDPSSAVGRALADRYLAGGDLAVLDHELSRRVGAGAPRVPDPVLSAEAARALFERAAQELLGGQVVPAALDPRVAAVLHRLEGATRLPPVATLAAEVDLSASRLQHLVRDQVGITLSRWLQWRRTLVALDLILNGTTVTEAACRAGFADGADFTRRFREFFAAPPTAAVQDPRIRAVVSSRLAQTTA